MTQPIERTTLSRPPRQRTLYLPLIFAGVAVLGAAAQRSPSSGAATKDLKPRVMRLVKDIRELAYRQRRRDEQLLAAFDESQRANTTASERKKIRAQWIRETDAAHDAFMREYKEKYWADAILLRDEMLRRLPRSRRQPQLAGLYQHPTNLLGVEAIADNLELLAKSLPD